MSHSQHQLSLIAFRGLSSKDGDVPEIARMVRLFSGLIRLQQPLVLIALVGMLCLILGRIPAEGAGAAARPPQQKIANAAPAHPPKLPQSPQPENPAESPFCVLETVDNVTQQIEGQESLREQRFSPASTFKMIIALAALQDHQTAPYSTFACHGAFLPWKSTALNLHQALVFSHNPAFQQLAQKVGEAKLAELTQKSGFCPSGPPKGWLKKGFRSAVWGGTLKVTPDEQHRFMIALAKESLPLDRAAQQELLTCLEWPTGSATARVWGKTGTFGGAVWFSGFGDIDGTRKVVTVMRPGNLSVRKTVIARFFRQFGLNWQEKFLNNQRFFRR